MIESFSDRRTESLWNGRRSRFPPELEDRIANKLMILNAATNIMELWISPGNRLESLRGDREGQYSIRINQQWRLCFRWKNGNAYDVEVTDYH